MPRPPPRRRPRAVWGVAHPGLGTQKKEALARQPCRRRGMEFDFEGGTQCPSMGIECLSAGRGQYWPRPAEPAPTAAVAPTACGARQRGASGRPQKAHSMLGGGKGGVPKPSLLRPAWVEHNRPKPRARAFGGRAFLVAPLLRAASVRTPAKRGERGSGRAGGSSPRGRPTRGRRVQKGGRDGVHAELVGSWFPDAAVPGPSA
jgi:hypothetical protein